MSNSRYYIVGNKEMWMIQFKDIDQYKSNNETISFAMAAAQKLGMRGERAHVCVLDDDGRWRCKWSLPLCGTIQPPRSIDCDAR
jgi:hypothetical protein